MSQISWTENGIMQTDNFNYNLHEKMWNKKILNQRLAKIEFKSIQLQKYLLETCWGSFFFNMVSATFFVWLIVDTLCLLWVDSFENEFFWCIQWKCMVHRSSDMSQTLGSNPVLLFTTHHCVIWREIDLLWASRFLLFQMGLTIVPNSCDGCRQSME